MALSYEDKKKRERLRHIHVLVADHDVKIGHLVRTVLENFGFVHIYLAKSAVEALEVLDSEPVDLLITEWPMVVRDELSLAEYIRRDLHSLNRDLPIIALTGKSDVIDVETARDAGITEYLVKPFTAKTLSGRILQVVENPRSFIIAPDFVGPDRRRRADDTKGDTNQRLSQQELEKYATLRDGVKIYNTPDHSFTVQLPNRRLKEKVGGDIHFSDILSDNVIAEAQKTIMNLQDDYLDWVTIDLNRLEQSYAALQQDLNDTQHKQALEEIAFTIKSQAGIFSYDLASKVGKSLFDYVKALEAIRDNAMVVIRKHIDVLYVIFHQEITGGGETMGDEMLGVLAALIKKYQ